MLNRLYLIFAGVVVFLSTLIGIFQKGKSVGKEEKEKEKLEEIVNAYEKASKVKQDVASMSDTDIDAELREFWTKKQ